MNGLITRMQTVYHQQGLCGLIKKVVIRALRLVIESNSAIWYTRDLAEIPGVIHPGVPARACFDKTNQVIRWLRDSAQAYAYNPKEEGSARKNGHIYAGAFYEGRCIACLKMGVAEVYLVDYGRSIRVAEGDVFIYDTYVLPLFRGKHVAGFLVSEALAQLKKNGHCRVACHIPAWNRISRRVYERAGFRADKFVRHIRLFGIWGFELSRVV